jgi:hypothetical protein
MRRGGSTLQAQLVSALLGGVRAHATSPVAIREMLARTDDAHERCILKCHEFVDELAMLQQADQARVVYVYRDIRDVVASISLKYSIPAFSFINGGALSVLREFEQWTSIPGIHVARYEDMIADLPAEIVRLGDYLGVSVDETRAAALASDFSLEKQKARITAAFSDGAQTAGRGRNAHDPLSLLHHDHIQSGEHGAYRRVLSNHELAALEWVCRRWMRASGYFPETSWALQVLAYSWFACRAKAHAFRVWISSVVSR